MYNIFVSEIAKEIGKVPSRIYIYIYNFIVIINGNLLYIRNELA
jgi:hypothetical protein